MTDRHLITEAELRAAGALDVPPAWRKSLRRERDVSRGLFDDLEDEQTEAGEPGTAEADGDAAADDRR